MRFWISYRRFLNTQWEGRRTRCIKKQKSQTAWYGKEKFLRAGSGYTLCNKTKQRGFEDEARKRIRHSHTQCKNNQSVLGIVPGLNRVIPVVEHLDDRAHQTGDQDNCSDYSRRPRSHGRKYTVAPSEYVEKRLRTYGNQANAGCPYRLRLREHLG